MARQLARLDCKVLCVDMKKDDVEETVQMIEKIDAKPGKGKIGKYYRSIGTLN